MSLLLDTDTCIALLTNRSEKVTHRFEEAGHLGLFLCSVVKGELLLGAHHSARPDANLRRLEQLFSLFPSAAFDDEAAEHYGVVGAQLKKKGIAIGHNDLMIASIALTRDFSVITRNVRAFGRVPGLSVESWF